MRASAIPQTQEADESQLGKLIASVSFARHFGFWNFELADVGYAANNGEGGDLCRKKTNAPYGALSERHPDRPSSGDCRVWIEGEVALLVSLLGTDADSRARFRRTWGCQSRSHLCDVQRATARPLMLGWEGQLSVDTRT
jgi:hypothetical protein